MAAISGRLTIGEEAYLRALTGRLVGRELFKGYNKVAIISYPDRICESVAAAAAVAYLERFGYGPGKVAIFDYQPDVDSLAEKVVSWGPEAVYLAFGGEQRMSDVSDMTVKVLRALANKGFKGALLIHVRAWLATKQFSSVTADPSLRSFLRSLKEIRLFTADANAKKFFFHVVKVNEDGSVSLTKIGEEDITDEHAQLLKLSLPPG
ncbi:MAG: hypothetical protein ACP5FT_03220 [Acidilobus sp.]